MAKHAEEKETHILPRTLREQIEAFAMAILLAVGLKYFLIEAYEIPTPSMQPTMMGSKAAGVHDRILVNKAAYLLRDPTRWDISIFRYPLNRSQNYVKRLVGLPGEHLKIIGGNVYRLLEENGKPALFECLRKPAHIQEGLWRTIYRSTEEELEKDRLNMRLSKGRWEIEGGSVFCEDTGQSASIEFMTANELVNHYLHGYPKDLQQRMARGVPSSSTGPKLVPDLRWSFKVTPDASVTELRFSQHEDYGVQAQLTKRRITLRIVKTDEGKAVAYLEVFELARGIKQERLVANETIQDIRFEPGQEISVVLTRVDDQAIAVLAGKRAGPIPFTWVGEPQPALNLAFKLVAKSAKRVRYREFHVERDLYYTSGDPRYRTDVKVPKDHYWMLGDNSQNSADGRAWESFTVRIGDDGRLLPLNSKAGKELSGGNRYAQGNPDIIDPDENPVFIPNLEKFVITDLYGGEHVVHGLPRDFENLRRLEPGLFVERKYIIGKAFTVFWPWYDIGLIR